jgi:hypothetical protein
MGRCQLYQITFVDKKLAFVISAPTANGLRRGASAELGLYGQCRRLNLSQQERDLKVFVSSIEQALRIQTEESGERSG